MPATRKQRSANRKNAKKSTGPKTEEGKQASGQNAITHGLHARDVVIASKYLREDPDEYRALLQSLHETLEPVGKFEEYLVGKIANALWRCNRAAAAETAYVNRSLDDIDDKVSSNIRISQLISDDPEIDDDPDSDYYCERRNLFVSANMVPGEHVSANILRYEMRLDRQLTRAYHILISHQDRRKQMPQPYNPNDPNEKPARADQNAESNSPTEPEAEAKMEN